MQNKRQTRENVYSIDEFTMGTNQLSFSFLGSHIDIEFVGKGIARQWKKLSHW